MPASGAAPGAHLLRLARIMLIIQVPGIIAAGTWLFWDFGLRTHDIGFGSAITGAYLLFAVGFMILMQMQWRKQARRQAMAASMAEASSE